LRTAVCAGFVAESDDAVFFVSAASFFEPVAALSEVSLRLLASAVFDAEALSSGFAEAAAFPKADTAFPKTRNAERQAAESDFARLGAD
jgi:hypothetical protein